MTFSARGFSVATYLIIGLAIFAYLIVFDKFFEGTRENIFLSMVCPPSSHLPAQYAKKDDQPKSL